MTAARATAAAEEPQPPQNERAEWSALSMAMKSEWAAREVLTTVRPYHFYRPAHHTICTAIETLVGRGDPADVTTVADELARRGELIRIGGAPYLVTIQEFELVATNPRYHAEIVRKAWQRRRVVEAGRRVMLLGYDESRDVDELIESLREVVDEVGAGSTQGGLVDELLDRDALADLPHPEPLIGSALPRHAYALLAGRHGTYKTFLALDWAASVATGRRWQGHATEKGRVLYIAGEGAYGLDARLDAWEQAWQTKIEPGMFTVLPRAINMLRDRAGVAELVRIVEEGGYVLVVVDTLRRASGGAEENSTQDMGVVVDNMERLKRATAAGTVLVVAHTDAGDNKVRGATTIEDDADVVWRVVRQGPGVRLWNPKAKDSAAEAEHHLVARTVGPSLIIRAASAPSGDELNDSQDRIMRTFRELFAADGGGPTKLQEACDSVSRSAFYRGLTALRESEHLSNIGTQKRPHYVLGPSAGGTALTCDVPPTSHRWDEANPTESHPSPSDRDALTSAVPPSPTQSHQTARRQSHPSQPSLERAGWDGTRDDEMEQSA